jgi:hypothetical protein
VNGVASLFPVHMLSISHLEINARENQIFLYRIFEVIRDRLNLLYDRRKLYGKVFISEYIVVQLLYFFKNYNTICISTNNIIK